ncbi:DUF5906 domain-containing protein, partial [Terrisporobacter petrolearius]|uniref:DUF5906 domain-containing protein n=1 Tax=Terrisporobacter petrolearius TaxID=1460447 RepID=UPI0022E81AAC
KSNIERILLDTCVASKKFIVTNTNDLYSYDSKLSMYRLLDGINAIRELKTFIRRNIPDNKICKRDYNILLENLITEPEIYIDDEIFKKGSHNINLRNGIYNLKNNTFCLKYPEKDRNLFFTTCLDCDFILSNNGQAYNNFTEAKKMLRYYMKNWNEYISTVFNGNSIRERKLLEIIGYLVSNIVPMKKIIILYGQPNTAKSKVILFLEDILTKLGNNHIFTNQRIEQLSEKFTSSSLANSRVCAYGEISNKIPIDIATIKSITGMDKQILEQKFKNPIKTTIFTKFCYATNEILNIKGEETTAFIDRLEILKFTHETPREKRKDNLEELFLLESKYIITLALLAFREVIYRGYFTPDPDIENIRREYIKQLPDYSINEFCNALLEYKEESILPTQQVYKIYVEYCQNNDLQPISHSGLTRNINEKYKICSKKKYLKDDGYENCFINLRFKDLI